MGPKILKYDMNQYQLGIIDICDSLVTDLLKFLKDEGRYKYRMVGYMKVMTDSFEAFYDTQTDEEIETYERMMYLISKSIYRDYSRLRVRKLSPADSVICILYKLLGEVDALPEVKELIQGFYENIKNRSKQDRLARIDSVLHGDLQEGVVGKLRLSDINLYQIENPLPRSQELQGSKEEWGISGGKEIEL